MKKIFLIAVISLVIVMPAMALAQAEETTEDGLTFDPSDRPDISGVEGSVDDVNLGRERPLTIAAGIVNGALGFLGILFLGLVLWGGFVWMNARGNQEEVAKAKKILTRAVIGLVIVLASFGISQFIFYQVSGSTIDLDTPEEVEDPWLQQ